MSSRYQKLLVFWGVVFVLSLLFTFTNLRIFRIGAALPDGGDVDKPEGGGNGGVDNGGDNGDLPAVIIPGETERTINLILSIATVVTSAGGFLVTTVYGSREDRRETEMHDLEVAKLRREIEQKELEIEQLKRNKSG